MERVAVISGLVIDYLLKIFDSLVPLAVIKVYLAAQGVGRSFGGASEVGCVPTDGEGGDGVGQVVDDVGAYFVGSAAGCIEGGKLLVDVAGLVIIGHSAPAVEHAEIGHGAEKFGLACHSVDGLGTDGHCRDIAYDCVTAVYEFVEILPVVLHAAAVGCESGTSRDVGPGTCAVGYVAAHVECKFQSETPA